MCRNQDVVLAAIESYVLVFILLVVLVMARVAAEDEVTEGIATVPTESGSIYSVLGSSTSPV